MSRRAVRCAVYTRKSSEEGLDQDFNSLDAQYEACAAYVASQKHEGWKLLPQRYDDGGVSGGTLERPDLKRLLADVDDGLIDMIVVYKIDRLTRSLSDFSRLIERLERANCSFVSVTQSFNTSTSMGRLTLNVLLSFAQFEREVTGERIRDKIAASKKKGMWMGGLVPLGYDHLTNPRGLVINKQEAETVREIFALYDRLGCLAKVTWEAERCGFRSKFREFKTGRTMGGSVMSRGQIHFILTNPVYIGQIRHKRESHDGLHQSIIEQELWDRVQRKLQEANAKPRSATQRAERSWLTGKLFDKLGVRLTPTHAQKGKRRHRYYVSSQLLRGEGDGAGWRFPAARLEQLVCDAIRSHVTENMHKFVQTPDIVQLKSVSERLLEYVQDAGLCASLIERVRVTTGELTITLSDAGLVDAAGLSISDLDYDQLTFSAPFFVRRRGVELKLLSGVTTRKPDPFLIRAIAQAHDWLEQVKAGRSITEIGKEHGLTDAPIRKKIALAFLSPRIVEAVLEGRQPADLTLRKLITTPLSNDWSEQEKQLGFQLP